MNKFLITKISFIASLLFFTPILLFAKKGDGITRNIDIAGLVVDSKTLLPIEAANIYGTDEKLLGKTDVRGYFTISLGFIAEGEMRFKLKIVKKGYNDIMQSEHWGNLPGNAKALMYFGLDKGSGSNSFSKLVNKAIGGLDYHNTLENFDQVKTARMFDDKLIGAKAGNQDVLIKVDSKLYIVDKTGWIAISSAKDSILINNKQLVIADQLNSTIKRKDIKSMTPLNAKGTRFAIYTK